MMINIYCFLYGGHFAKQLTYSCSVFPPLPTLELNIYFTLQFSSVAQSCPTLCDPMNCSTPGLSVHHQLPEFTQTHVHRVSDAIQPSHPLLPPSPPAPNPSQHQGLFQKQYGTGHENRHTDKWNRTGSQK